MLENYKLSNLIYELLLYHIGKFKKVIFDNINFDLTANFSKTSEHFHNVRHLKPAKNVTD